MTENDYQIPSQQPTPSQPVPIYEEMPAKKRGASTVLIVILAVLALPVGLPLVISVFAVILSLAITAAALMGSGIVSVLAFPFAAFTDIGFAFLMGGYGLVSIGVGILLIAGLIALIKGISKLFTRREKHVRQQTV